MRESLLLLDAVVDELPPAAMEVEIEGLS